MRLKGLGMFFLFFFAVGAIVGGYEGVARSGTGIKAADQSKPSQLAKANIPDDYLKVYRDTGRRSGVAWTVLAGIGKVESEHGQGSAPGIRSGVNRFGCCAGPMQFNVRNGPRTTWDRYGRGSVYNPRDAIPAAARLLKANSYGDKTMRPGYRRCPGINARPGTINALRHYNNACWYVADVLAWSERYRSGRTA